jgi:xylulokinase
MHHLEVIRDMDLEVKKLYISNGGARSDLWKRVVIDALGLSGIYVPNHPGSSLGAAFLAAHGTGITEKWEGLKEYMKNGVEIPFSKDKHEIYRKYFQLYKKIYLSLKPIFAEMSRITKSE